MPEPAIVELAERIRDLERRVASTVFAAEVTEISGDATTLTVARTLAGTESEVTVEGVMNTMTTYTGGGMQHARLRARTANDAGDFVLVVAPGGNTDEFAFAVRPMPNLGRGRRSRHVSDRGSIAVGCVCPPTTLCSCLVRTVWAWRQVRIPTHRR